MFADTADQLREMIKENPDVSPSTFLRDDSFAASCYDKRTVMELKSAFNRDAEPEDCKTWRLSRSEWKENIEMALVALLALQLPIHKEKEDRK